MGKVAPVSSVWDERARTASLVASMISTIVIGLQTGLARVSVGASMLGSVVWVGSLIFWCFFDARVRRSRLPSSAWWLFFFGWPLAIPGYLLSTRGVSGIWITIRYMLLCILVIILSAQLPLFLLKAYYAR